MGQGYEDHLVTQEADIPEVDKVQWRKIDAQLCSVLWQSGDPKILFHLWAYKTCFKFWNQEKGLYMNDIQRLYKVTSSIVNVRQQDMDLSTYIGQIASLKEEFLTVMPLTTDVGDQRTQMTSSSWFLRLLASVQILRPSAIRFLAVSPLHPWMMFSQTNSRGGRSGNRGRGQRPYCTYCNKLGHTRDRCYQLHGRPPRTAHVAQSFDPQLPQPPSSSTSQGISLTNSEYDDYLRYQAAKSASVASVAQTGNASTCLTHISSLGPWILDSGASDHISAHPLLSLPHHSVFYAPETEVREDDGIRRESQGLYHLISPSTSAVCMSIDAPLLIHNRLGHPRLSKFQKMDKLSAQSHKCIFLGYSRLQKGYRCYSSETHRYFLSTDVTFFEDSPFFSTSESLLVSEVLPLPIISPPDAVPSRPLRFIITVIVSLFLLLWPRYLLTHFLSLRLLLPRFCLLLLTYLLLFEKSTPEALSHPGWRQAMIDEMIALHSNGTWDLVFYPLVDRLKARLVAKGYTQVYGSDYGDTFSPVAKIASVRLLLSMDAMRSWPLYQLPRSPYGLKESPRAWFSRFSSVVHEFGMFRSTADHSVFYHHNSSGQCIYLVVYVDDIVIIGSDQNGIQKLKQHLFTHFQTKDLGKLKYFLGIEIAQSSSGVVLSQRKYALDILEETGMLDCKPVDTPMDPNVKLIPRQGSL
ncbi:Retrovirus-related Pol polyprotein from transposon RE1 [Vitis vinifera]|uniref:Retrovirus-related Pol polyprotein from transposon RE1 n=1 Tax=Vitis vinifera TaxID=29760 RepID=A0A438GFH3_VITVI|nr:Retrovirus-related Pol polyprotein from transposon RE1 [Vitis vinifera]